MSNQIKGKAFILFLWFLGMVTATGFLHAREMAQPIPFQLQQESKTPLSPTELNEGVELLLFDQTNQARQGQSLDTLSEDLTLKKVAKLHSQDMLKRSYLSHISPEGKSPVDRLKALSSTRYLALGENLHIIKSAQGLSDPKAISEQMMTDWLHSKVHRRNILGKEFTLLGVGCASNGKTIFCTQVFGKR